MHIYEDLRFPEAPLDRPYTYINMVSTIDGKTITGERSENVLDLGSKTDHEVMDRIERKSDAIILGAGSARANPKSWDPHTMIRVAVSNSGNLPFDAKFFTGGQSFVACPRDVEFQAPVPKLRYGNGSVDFRMLFRHLRQNLDVQYLNCLGGSELNAELLRAGLVDELFLTVAPKIKLGRDVPTYAGGEPLPREAIQNYHLIEHHVVGDEVFLRYRRDVEK